jgi:hypothetical protein
MGRLPASTAQLALNGGLKHDPKRYANRGTEPVPSGPIGNPSSHFCPALKTIWKELKSQSLPNTLGSSERLILEVMCRLTLKMRGNTISTGETSRLIGCLCRLGMTPTDRPRVQILPTDVKPTEKESVFAALFANPIPIHKRQAVG